MEITTANYKETRGISTETLDTRIDLAIVSAKGFIESVLGIDSLDETTYTDATFSGNGTKRLPLKNWPVSAVSAVAYLGDDGTENSVDADSYRLESSKGILWKLGASDGFVYSEDTPNVSEYSRGDEWVRGNLNIQITYTAGYASDDFPARVASIVYQLVDMELATARRDPTIKSESIGSFSQTFMSAGETLEQITATIRSLDRGGL